MSWSSWLQSGVAAITGSQEPVYGEEAIHSICATVTPETAYTELDASDYAWIAPEWGSNVETQTFYIAADSGHVCFAQIIHSNPTGLAYTAQFTCRVFDPSNPQANIWTSTTLEDWNTKDDACRSFKAKGVSVMLNEDNTAYTLKITVNPQTIVNFTMTRVSPGFKIGADGATLFGPDKAKPWGSMKHLFWPRCKVEGVILVNGAPVDVKGRGLFIHALQGMKPHHAARKWNFCNFQGKDLSATMMEFTTPESYGNTTINVGGLAKEGVVLAATIDNEVRHNATKLDEETGWQQPTEMVFSWRGVETAEHSEARRPVTAHLSLQSETLLERVDVLAEIPPWLKKVVHGVSGTRPFIYQYAKPATLEVQIGDEKVTDEEPSTPRVLRSQTAAAAASNTPVAQEVQAATHQDKPSASEPAAEPMSESKRRSSRKHSNRHDELLELEQSAGASSAQPDEVYEEEYEEHYDEEDDRYDEDEEAEAHFMQSARGLTLNAMAGLFSGQAGQFKNCLQQLKAQDPSIQLIALSELANILSMSTEDSLAGFFQIDAFVSELVKIMKGPDAFGEENSELMLLACRCLANLMEALPPATANVAYGNAVPVLCQKLLEIQYIDLAEQALSTLEKISKDYPSAVVKEGGLAACLTYLDFFSTSVQRTAVNTAANCAKGVSAESFGIVRDVIPTLQTVIAGSDAKVVEAGCLCLTRLIESFQHNTKHLEELLEPSLTQTILAILDPMNATGSTLSEHTQTRFLHVLALGAKASQLLAARLISSGLISTLYQLLTSLDVPDTVEGLVENSVVVLQALIHHPREQIAAILSLISAILPGLPSEEYYIGLMAPQRSANDNRAELFERECPEQYERFARIVLPTLLDMYNATVNAALRRTCLLALLKLVSNLKPEVMARVVHNVPLAVFIAGLLGSADENLILAGIRLSNLLLQRLASIYANKLAVEGCVDAIEALQSQYANLPETKSMPIKPPAERRHTHEDDEDQEDIHDDDLDDVDEMDDDEDMSEESDVQQPESHMIYSAASDFLKQYKSVDGGDATRESTLATLSDLAERLKSTDIETALKDFGDMLAKQPVSSYYLEKSGILGALLTALTNDSSVQNRRLFAKHFSSATLLVSKLQQLLSRAEKFEVATSSAGDERRSASILAKQLKLKLVAGDDIPRPFRMLMVSIHAIATFKALDDYLRPRIAVAKPSNNSGVAALAQLTSASAAAGPIGETSVDEDEAAVSVEVSGGKAIAKTADGEKIATPRTSTPDTSTPRKQALSYSAALQASPKDWHLQFEVDGQIVAHDTTIYGGVSQPDRNLQRIYEVKFRKVAGPAPAPVQVSEERSLGLPASVQNDSAAPILELLKVLHDMETLPPASFVNTKLTAKLNRQLEEPLIVASSCLPPWSLDLPRHFPFLFPFETRYLFLQSTSFGYSRSMSRWQSQAKSDDDTRPFLGRLQRQKVRISRPRLLESAIKVMELYGASPSVLEVEYFDEVGTGLGPTLEFYSSVSLELSKNRLHLWRADDEEAEYAFSTAGLFPAPLPSCNEEKTKVTLALFKMLGTFVARSMLDSRMIDLALSPMLFKVDFTPTWEDVAQVDPALGKSLALLAQFADAYQAVLDADMTDSQRGKAVRAITFENCTVEDLGLDFAYPGNPEVELMPGGSQVEVTIHNVADYVTKVTDATLGSGVARQIAAFRKGFSAVFPYSALRAFTPLELSMLFGSGEEDWSAETLADNIKADHGYTMDSKTIQNLISVLSQLDKIDRRAFLQFITGSPKLPIGGFKALTPQFTIVCRPHEAPMTADDYLPSVMTCVNYLKMPDYSSREVLQTKLVLAMREGSGSFHLS
ncbi:Svf1-like-domain-containing protein [Protomyces lactucae-debilis]|uniref:HECT-type E3 ubiquitin transferase n=1 Tax=Protomyces lactucae-debilis TaxID=2754530 RepID=A0A1Y2FBN1_PROLT|nr:Svf1-like-domain-containing protein [Protomyces lactucae-debilis]ORY81328.1 Svf1-like-domain-containing protein [Protomyces lactucae-debilis]